MQANSSIQFVLNYIYVVKLTNFESTNLFRPVFVLNNSFQWLSFGKGLESDEGDSVGWQDFIVIGGIREGERQKSLLLQVGLVNAGEALDDDGASAEVTRFQRRVLA